MTTKKNESKKKSLLESSGQFIVALWTWFWRNIGAIWNFLVKHIGLILKVGFIVWGLSLATMLSMAAAYWLVSDGSYKALESTVLIRDENIQEFVSSAEFQQFLEMVQEMDQEHHYQR